MSENKNKKEPAEERRAVHTDINSVRKNERSIRRMKRLIALLIVILVGIAVYLTYPYWLPQLEGIFDKPVSTVYNNGSFEKGNFPIQPAEKTTNIFAVGNELMTADTHSLTFYDANGKRISVYAHGFSNPVERVSGKRVLVFDNGRYGFKMFNKKGELYSKTTDDIILSGSLSENGTAAIITASDKYAATVLFYNKEGKLIYRYNSTSRIMSASVSENGKEAYVCTFSSMEGVIHSQVHRLDFDKDGEQMVSENIRTLAIDCITNDAGDIVIAGDTGLYTLSPEGKLVSSYEYDGELKGYVLGRGCSAALVSGSSKDSSKLIIARSGAADTEAYREVSCANTAKCVKIADERVMLLTTGSALSYAYSGSLAATAEIGREYINFEYLDGAVFLAGKRGIDKIKFEM